MNLPPLPNGLSLEQVRKYLENRKKEFGTLAGLLVAKDKNGIRGIAHRIKGNAALYGMADLGLAAGRLVEAVDGEDWDVVSSMIDAMIVRLAEERVRFGEGP
jgi:HPt (histidine-containing phosphotransfer) domain-containing protein